MHIAHTMCAQHAPTAHARLYPINTSRCATPRAPSALPQETDSPGIPIPQSCSCASHCYPTAPTPQRANIQRLCTQRHIPPPRPRRRPPATGHSRLSEKRLASSACCCCCGGMTGAMPMAPAICCCCCKTCCCMSTCCCIAICCCIAACCCCHMARCCWAARCCMTTCCGVTRGVGMHLALPRPGEPPIAPKSALSCERSPPIERNAAAVGADAIALSAPMATFGAGGGAGAAAPPFGAVRSAKLTTDSARDSSECGSFGGGGPASAGPGRAVPPPAEAEVEAEAAPLAPSARMASSSFLRVAAAA
mmetsp:Transcript_33959/g.112392  ORF Transcript_33959/g.112392 Transcript_33959/m.112392 type:complete len:306 (+) Transcript_33959:107-1024(+)